MHKTRQVHWGKPAEATKCLQGYPEVKPLVDCQPMEISTEGTYVLSFSHAVNKAHSRILDPLELSRAD